MRTAIVTFSCVLLMKSYIVSRLQLYQCDSPKTCGVYCSRVENRYNQRSLIGPILYPRSNDVPKWNSILTTIRKGQRFGTTLIALYHIRLYCVIKAIFQRFRTKEKTFVEISVKLQVSLNLR